MLKMDLKRIRKQRKNVSSHRTFDELPYPYIAHVKVEILGKFVQKIHSDVQVARKLFKIVIQREFELVTIRFCVVPHLYHNRVHSLTSLTVSSKERFGLFTLQFAEFVKGFAEASRKKTY